MNSRERVEAVLNGDIPDRPPTRLRALPEVQQSLEHYLGLKGDALLDRLAVDLVRVSFIYSGPDCFNGDGLISSAGKDIFGIEWTSSKNKYCTYNEATGFPLKNATISEIENHSWPSPDWFDYNSLSKEIDSLSCNGKRAVMLFGGELETLWFMRGIEGFMMDMIENPEIVDAIIGHITDFFASRLRRALDVVGHKIDMVGFSGDLGSQRGMLFSPELWRRFLKPQLKELTAICHDAGIHTFYHSCGGIVSIIPDLIEAGVDILDPIQTRAEGMVPEVLKEKFGNDLIFHGGVDEQELLPRATPEEVAAEVRNLISTLGCGGGYILSSSHTIQPDTPPENIVAMFDTAKNHSY
jgi:uroporphyrinogen decarboxylase